MIECERFRAIDEGILLFGEESDEEEAEEEEATGFIPMRALRFVLPDDVEYRTAAGVGQPTQQGQYESPPPQQGVQQPQERPPQRQPNPR